MTTDALDHPGELGAPEQPPPPPGRTWSQGLMTLGLALRAEARVLPGRWCWYVFRGGACVAMRQKAEALEIRVSRSNRPEGSKAQEAWDRECEVFARYLGCLGWEQRTEHRDHSIARLWFKRGERA